MFGLGRSKALLRRFLPWFHRDTVGRANWKIIPFDRPSVVHETFPPAGQSSSGVEQRTHKPLVGGSNPSSGTSTKPQQNPLNTKVLRAFADLYLNTHEYPAIPVDSRILATAGNRATTVTNHVPAHDHPARSSPPVPERQQSGF